MTTDTSGGVKGLASRKLTLKLGSIANRTEHTSATAPDDPIERAKFLEISGILNASLQNFQVQKD